MADASRDARAEKLLGKRLTDLITGQRIAVIGYDSKTGDYLVRFGRGQAVEAGHSTWRSADELTKPALRRRAAPRSETARLSAKKRAPRISPKEESADDSGYSRALNEVSEAIKALSEEHRAVVELMRNARATVSAAARTLKIPVSTAHDRYQAAILQLQRSLKPGALEPLVDAQDSTSDAQSNGIAWCEEQGLRCATKRHQRIVERLPADRRALQRAATEILRQDAKASRNSRVQRRKNASEKTTARGIIRNGHE